MKLIDLMEKKFCSRENYKTCITKKISCDQNAKLLSIIVECTPDIAHVEKLCVTVRFVGVKNENSDN